MMLATAKRNIHNAYYLVILGFMTLYFISCNPKQILQGSNDIFKLGTFDNYTYWNELDSLWKKESNVKWINDAGDHFVRLENNGISETKLSASLSLDSAWRRIRIVGKVRIPKLEPKAQFGKTARLFTAFYSSEDDLLSFTGDISANHITWRNPIENWAPFEFTFNLPLYVDEGNSKGQNKMLFQFELNEAVGILDVNDFSVEVIDEKQVVNGQYYNTQILPTLNQAEIHGASINKADEQKIEYFIYVDSSNPESNDENKGTENAPLRTLNKALFLAKESQQACKIILNEGKYHEENSIVSPQNGESQPLIVIEGKQKGKVIITGAKEFKGWQPTVHEDTYEHHWSHKFGISKQIWAGNGPWGNAGYIKEEGLRKEMLFVDNIPYQQVFDKEDLTDKTFYIDEKIEKVYLKLPPNESIENVLVEIATKGNLLNVNNKENLVLRNLVFEKAAKFVPFGSVEFSYCKNILVEDCDFFWSNATGILFNFAENITLRNVRSNNNGWNGYKFEFAQHVITENCETSYNNWRGNMGGINGWDLAGNKNYNVHHFQIKNYKSYDNRGEGLWFDWCCHNIQIEESELIGNHSTGIYWEASQGPAIVKNCRIAHNGNSGIQNAEAWNLTLKNNLIYDNYASQLEVRARLRSGEDRYSPPNYLFSALTLNSQNNTFSSTIPNSFLYEVYSMKDSSIMVYNNFLESYQGENNTFFHTLFDTAFSFERHRYTDLTKFDRMERGGRKELSYWVGKASEQKHSWENATLPRIKIVGIEEDEVLSINASKKIAIEAPKNNFLLKAGYVKIGEGRDKHKYFLSDLNKLCLDKEEITIQFDQVGDYFLMAYGFDEKGALIESSRIQFKVQ